jgi:predicted sulfurtransferase
MMDEPHRNVVLFYKYFILESAILSELPSTMNQIESFLRETCMHLHMRGRVLLATEGINGTLSSINSTDMNVFINAIENYKISDTLVFSNIDWKMSDVDDDLVQQNRHPFPDLKISIVKEIVSTGNVIQVEDIPKYGGRHLSPEEFHNVLEKYQDTHGNDGDKKELVVIDVRNTFEHAIGHFQYSHDKKAAINPEMVTFSSFDGKFCAENADYLKGKRVLMYCTGGIRCEKASAMLRKRGVDDVSQLSGGIHRYLEQYPSGFFEGRNFVFDQRVALAPSGRGKGVTVVGRCIECCDEYDEISGSRICTVCRDLVLVCPKCVSRQREHHCSRHSSWRGHYFTFLDRFEEDELRDQMKGLIEIRENTTGGSRKTLIRQITKIKERIVCLQSKLCRVNNDTPRRCRTCHEPDYVCDGLCWGFWKQSKYSEDTQRLNLPIAVGDLVKPGPDWNEPRFGKKEDFNIGTVLEVKSWNSGGLNDNCVSVVWDNNSKSGKGSRNVNVYRWGTLDTSGLPRYDLELVCSSDTCV